MNNLRKENARLLKLTEVLINRFPDLDISPSFKGNKSTIGIYAWSDDGEEILADDFLLLSLRTDQEIMEKAEKVYLTKKELENE